MVASAHSDKVTNSSSHTAVDIWLPALTASRTKAATPTAARLWCGRLWKPRAAQRHWKTFRQRGKGRPTGVISAASYQVAYRSAVGSRQRGGEVGSCYHAGEPGGSNR